jgi:hypothetical protein
MNVPGGKGKQKLKDDNLTAICELSRKCGSFNVSRPTGTDNFTFSLLCCDIHDADKHVFYE